MQSSEPMFLPVSVLDVNGLVNATINTARKDYILLGGIIFVTFLNFALWIGFRDLGFLLYGFFSGSVFLSISKTNGYLDYFLWPNHPIFNSYSAIFEIFSAITGALFTIHFLRLKEYLPKIRKFIIGQIVFCCIAMFVSLSGYNQASLMMVQTSAFLFVFIAIYASARVYLLGFKAARFYLLSWGFFLVGVLIYIVLNAGIIEYSFLKANLINIAVGFEIFFSSIAIADKIIILRKEREREIKARINLLNEQNDMLEKLVSERTKEIAAANEELISQNEHLEEQKILVMNINSNLEKIVSERTEMIRRQFDRLEEYAYFNAHKVRGPLARILGLINIYYLEDEKKDTDDYLIKIKQNAEELDQVVRGISNQVLNDLEEKS